MTAGETVFMQESTFEAGEPAQQLEIGGAIKEAGFSARQRNDG
jgi:hypothetical protein